MRRLAAILLLALSTIPAPGQSFSAHKDHLSQTVSGPNVDTVVTFNATKWNVGGYFNLATGRFQPTSGQYDCKLSINVVNPTDGGKHYALFRKNGDQNGFEDLFPSRPRILNPAAPDTVGTSTSADIMLDGTDYLEFVFSHSNGTGSRTLDGHPFATWASCRRVGDYVLPAFEGTTGHLGTAINCGSNTFVDRTWKLKPGRTVKRIGFITFSAGTYPVKIVKRNSAGSYDVITTASLSHSGGGWETGSISDYVVPADGKDYFVAVTTANGPTHPTFNLKALSYAAGEISGAVTMTEEAPAVGLSVPGTRAVYE